ncbi:hypothetical protein ACQ5SK_06775 [Bradyrhizobium japonicum]
MENQMRKSLMVSAAVAALLATTGFATAQGANQGAAKDSPTAASPKGDPAAPMNAPAAKGVEKATPGAGSKEMAPQQAQGKPDAKTTGDMKADGKSKASESDDAGRHEGPEESGRRNDVAFGRQGGERDESRKQDEIV